ncbi:MAG: M28 family peptidase, partial [Pseudomonadota bacterium]
MIRLTAFAAAALVCAACSPADVADAGDNAAASSGLRTVSAVTESDIAARIAHLADDSFEGRAPGTDAGEAAAQWIADEMARVGLKPAVDGSFFQQVEMVAQTVKPEASGFSVSVGDEVRTLAPGEDIVFWTKRQTEAPIAFDGSDIVFVGYGVVAPEYGWDDYAGLDAAGKTVVMLVNDPGFATEDPDLFKGRAMTYYGRWTYKFEEAARQGATSALVIHETEPASYPWAVIGSDPFGERADLVRNDAGESRIPIEGWLSAGAAEAMFAAAGLDFGEMKEAAKTPGFTPVPMSGVKASARLEQSVTRAKSRNVAGMVEGAQAPDEFIIYTAHWDHLGQSLNFATDDAINNGAVDNATGTSMVLEIAEALAAGEAPARSVLFLAVTLEESGLLGSAYFAENPFVPLNKIVAGINIDAYGPIGRTRDMKVVGSGASELEDILADILAEAGRVTSPDPRPEAGLFYRSDHVSLAKKGVPMMYADAGMDKLDGGVEAGLAEDADYYANRYHKPSDEYDDSWDVSGMAEDAEVLLELGRRIALSPDWPTW